MAQKQRYKAGVVEKKLVGVADVVITAAQRRKDPTLSIPIRSLSNVTFNERKGIIEMGRKKQARSFFNHAQQQLPKRNRPRRRRGGKRKTRVTRKVSRTQQELSDAPGRSRHARAPRSSLLERPGHVQRA